MGKGLVAWDCTRHRKKKNASPCVRDKRIRVDLSLASRDRRLRLAENWGWKRGRQILATRQFRKDVKGTLEVRAETRKWETAHSESNRRPKGAAELPRKSSAEGWKFRKELAGIASTKVPV